MRGSERPIRALTGESTARHCEVNLSASCHPDHFLLVNRVIFELLWRDYFKFVAVKYGNRLFKVEGTITLPVNKLAWGRKWWKVFSSCHPFILGLQDKSVPWKTDMKLFDAWKGLWLLDVFQLHSLLVSCHILCKRANPLFKSCAICDRRGQNGGAVCRRQHERVGHDGLHVQQGAAKRCQLPHQRPRSGLEDGSRVVWIPSGERQLLLSNSVWDLIKLKFCTHHTVVFFLWNRLTMTSAATMATGCTALALATTRERTGSSTW